MIKNNPQKNEEKKIESSDKNEDKNVETKEDTEMGDISSNLGVILLVKMILGRMMRMKV